jgi:hypothetical protein
MASIERGKDRITRSRGKITSIKPLITKSRSSMEERRTSSTVFETEKIIMHDGFSYYYYC